MPAYKTYLLYLGLLLGATLAGCGSSSSTPQQLPDRSGSPAQVINENYQQGRHFDPLSFAGSCFACHASEGSELLKTVTGSGSTEYNLCVSCHNNVDPDALSSFPEDTHGVFIVDYATAKNACTQCHDPHAATKFAQDEAKDITTDWTNSGHGDVKSAAFTRPYISGLNCLQCHSGSVFAQTISGVTTSEIDISGGAQVIGCISCHDLTARDDAGKFKLGALRQINSVTFPSGIAVSIDAGNNLCLTCHQGRSSTPTVNARIAAGNLAFSNIHYAPAGATLFGSDVQGGYEYEGQNYRRLNNFPAHATSDTSEFTTCTGCHLGNTADHSFSVALVSCQDCHPGGDSFSTMGSLIPNYDGAIIINFTQIEGLKGQLSGLLLNSDSGINEVLDENGEPIFPYYSGITTEQQLKALYNLQFASNDKAGYIHNGGYLRQLLFDSIVNMDGTPVYPRP